MNNEILLKEGLEKYKLQYTEEQIKLLVNYMDAVLEMNKSINLTSITQEEEFINKHILDSLIMVKDKEIFHGIKLLDLGTGAGFPGVPLKIIYPQIELTLLDSVEKKLTFISRTISEMNIMAYIIHNRAEILGQDLEHRGKYDIVTSRAVANIQTLTELSLPLVKIGGTMIASKGPKYVDEISMSKNAITILGGDVDNISINQIDLEGMERYIISIKKIKSTPMKYPRKPNLPNKKPL